MTEAPILDCMQTLQAAIDEFVKHAGNGGFDELDPEEFLDATREVEAMRRQLDTADYPIVAGIEQRGLPDKHGTRNAAGLLSGLWRITPHEAKTRVTEAQQLAGRVMLTGEVLDPLRPHAAKARTLGILSGEQTALILRTLHALPRTLPVQQVDAAEQILVQAGHALGPLELRNVARQLRDTIDPDGTAPSETEHARRRTLNLHEEHDGMTRLSGLLDPATAAKAHAVLGALAAPRPDDPTGPDDRSAAQRRHDALDDILNLALRAEDHAHANSSAVTVHLTMTAQQFETSTGHATTSYGQRITVAEALRMAAQARIAWTVHDSHGAILNHGRKRRLASKDQIDALIARDGGCANPGCLIPAEWCERHHILEWINGGTTDLDNLVLLCRYHHTRLLQQGWTIQVRNGIPWFIPPEHIDKHRKPLRNIRALNATKPFILG